MVKTFKLEILASDHVFYSGECDELIFPGQDGSFGILPNHQPMITCLNAGSKVRQSAPNSRTRISG